MSIIVGRLAGGAAGAALVALPLVVLGAAFGTSACRQDEPGLEPKTPPNMPIPMKLDRPDDPKTSPTKVPGVSPEGGTTRALPPVGPNHA